MICTCKSRIILSAAKVCTLCGSVCYAHDTCKSTQGTAIQRIRYWLCDNQPVWQPTPVSLQQTCRVDPLRLVHSWLCIPLFCTSFLFCYSIVHVLLARSYAIECRGSASDDAGEHTTTIGPQLVGSMPSCNRSHGRSSSQPPAAYSWYVGWISQTLLAADLLCNSCSNSLFWYGGVSDIFQAIRN